MRLVVGGSDHLQCLARTAEVEQNVSLLTSGEREKTGVASLAGRTSGPLEVIPRL